MKIIDLSAWQTNVNWQAIADAGFGGVILKIGERSELDSMFVNHVNNAVAQGLKYGVYYYGHANNIDAAKTEETVTVAETEVSSWWDKHRTDIFNVAKIAALVYIAYRLTI